MENLQTLLKELTYIEEVNESLKKELELEKEKHAITQQKLDTSSKIVYSFHFIHLNSYSIIQ
jgi:hypothetical protein